MSEQYQRRYFYSHTIRMLELCYPAVAPLNQPMDDRSVHQMVQCINKLGSAIEHIQQVSDNLA